MPDGPLDTELRGLIVNQGLTGDPASGRDLPSNGTVGQGSNQTNVRAENLVYKASPKHHASSFADTS